MRPYGPGITDTIALVGIVFSFLVFWKYEKVELVEVAILPQKNPDNISLNMGIPGVWSVSLQRVLEEFVGQGHSQSINIGDGFSRCSFGKVGFGPSSPLKISSLQLNDRFFPA